MIFRKLFDLASKADSLPDASRLKTWSDIIVSLLTTPATVVVTLVGGSLAFFQWYLPYREAESKKQLIVRSPVHVGIIVKAVPDFNAVSIVKGSTYIPIIVQVEAQNTTNREYAIMDSRWIALGIQVIPKAESNIQDLKQQSVQDNINSLDLRHHQYYFERTRLIASGRIFTSDNVIRPSEVLRQSFVIYTRRNELNYLRIQFSIPIIAKSTQKYLKDEFSMKPRLLYRSNEVVDAAEWWLCPDSAGMSNGGESVRFFEKTCQAMPEDEKSLEEKKTLWSTLLHRGPRIPVIAKSNYLLSFATINLPFRAEDK
jgi:hypothetical protein